MIGAYDGKDEVATIDASFNLPDQAAATLLTDFTVQEVVLMESLLTPGLQTAIKVHSHLHNLPAKNLDNWKNIIANLKITRPILEAYKLPHQMDVTQRVYRLANRKLINNNNEEYTLFCCDDSLLNNARSLVSRPWNCRPPHEVVQNTLSQCCGIPADRLDIETSGPHRDYIAENIHPFEVVKQQTDVALSVNGNDPSFVHYMTYENGGTHHFKSLHNLTKQTALTDLSGKPFILRYSEASGAKRNDKELQAGYRNPSGIMQYSFPCDFDLLADLLNGIDVDGKDITSIVTINPLLSQFSLGGVQTIDCGIGKGVYKVGMTNYNSAQQQGSCNINTEQYMLQRQARMNLLEPDKVALRMTVPWNPIYHAGKVIRIELYNKNDNKIMLYGSGDYLISSMIHTVKRGGFSTTTMDCVSTTVGQGMQ